jgi:hypothetical protein
MRNSNFTLFRQHQVILPGSIIKRLPDPTTDAGKTRILAEAIVKAQTARGAVELRDLTQAGVAEADAKRLFDPALTRARQMDPSLFRAVAA